ncbi:hypothetical protein L5515_012280 [Caenorhabditis briggsae]|uniref:Galactosylgalactosylxylosylprotein 3-beta-glucuronosyltransferase n=1 Tax=Caenorhabditis briggsae TaxID=6238 RepID=A0AAE9JIS7_CAEBR|nr:hypothetical protein L5515_012280 [Caenorhabditis briggsae]
MWPNFPKERFYLPGMFNTRNLNNPRLFPLYVGLIVFLCLIALHHSTYIKGILMVESSESVTVIVVTPTYKRYTRVPDMIRMANTLAHVKNLYWIVIEDGNKTSPAVKDILDGTGLQYTYMAYPTAKGFPEKGWYQRTMALRFIRSNTEQILGPSKNGVVYFGDDDNSYDIRLFTDYIRNVKKLGIWAVGYCGGSPVEAPNVTDGKVPSFNVQWSPKRVFAVDMAGFAVNLKVVLNSDAEFGTFCKRGTGAPETCLLEDMGLDRTDIEPFGWKGKEGQRKIYAWHTKTQPPYIKGKLETFGYQVEIE